MEKESGYRQIPAIDSLMAAEEIKPLGKQYGYAAALEAARTAEEEIRERIAAGGQVAVRELVKGIPARMKEILEKRERSRMHRVINATGIILHTNLGRAPVSREVMEYVSERMTGYTNLEFRLEDGSRGNRQEHFAEELCRLTKAEAAAAVNNNAAAVLLMLTALAAGREVIVSRGELVEIGGKFRVPEVCAQSGARLVEAGCTNRTYLEDYENAVTENTAAFLKVHTSNYKITGFTHAPSVPELVKAGHSRGIPVLVDLGSGSLTDFTSRGLPAEETVQALVAQGADVVAFSGDKLLGGPQAGILVGKKELIEKICRHPLMRALRIDKFTASALEATLGIYGENEEVWEKIPVLEMLGRSPQRLEEMAQQLMDSLKGCTRAVCRVVHTETYPGGGSMPQDALPGAALAITHRELSAEALAGKLRIQKPPVIGRIERDCVLLEMRTVFPGELPMLAAALRAVL